MRIRAPKGLTRFQIVFASALGIAGGVYVWKPIFEKQFNPNPTTQTETVAGAGEVSKSDSKTTSEFDK